MNYRGARKSFPMSDFSYKVSLTTTDIKSYYIVVLPRIETRDREGKSCSRKLFLLFSFPLPLPFHVAAIHQSSSS